MDGKAVFTIDPPVQRTESARVEDEFVSHTPVHPSQATYNAQIKRLWAFKRHLMQPTMSPVLRKSEVAIQLAAVFRKSLFQRGGKGRSSRSPTRSPARSPANGAEGGDDPQAPVVVIIQGDAGSGKTSLISHCLATTRMYVQVILGQKRGT